MLDSQLQKGIEAKFADLFQDDIEDGSAPLIFQRDMMKTNQVDNCDDNIDLKLPENTKWTEPIYSQGRLLVVEPHKRILTPKYRYRVPGQVPNAGRENVSNIGE